MADEFTSMLLRQLDLRMEAANLDRFHRNFAVDSGEPLVLFPRPIDGYASPRVLVKTIADIIILYAY